MYERTIISDGASKTWAMTGWRIGFTSNPALAPVFTRWITNTDSCASQISQWAAVEAITGPQESAEKMKKKLPRAARSHRGPAQPRCPGVKCQVPGGAFYVWPNITEACRRIGAADSEEFRKRLLHRGRRRGARRHPLRHARARRRPARALLLRGFQQAIEAGVQRLADFIKKNTKKAA
jgi:aspartate/methionine/tyrosine aminotransferase